MQKPALDHIGLVVSDLDQALARFEALFGVKPSYQKEKKEMGLKSAGLEFANVNLELIEFTDPNGEIAGLLGLAPGVNHLGIAVADMDAFTQRLAEQGMGLAPGFPRAGSRGPIAFNLPDQADGLLLELVQPLSRPES